MMLKLFLPGRFVYALCAAVTVAACSADPQEVSRKYVASGDGYVERGQFKEAIIEYRNALKATPDAADIRYKLGRAYEESGDPVNAYTELSRAADLNPTNVDAQVRTGTLLLVAREFDAARTRAELALKADPNLVAGHILLGNAMAGLNETAPALRQIEQAISLDPLSAPAWTALGAVTFLGGKKEEAAAAFQKAVEIAPRSMDARLALANYQWAKGALDGAEATLKAALGIEPANASAHRALALLYVTTRRAPEAEPHFRVLAVDGTGKLALADYYMGLGRNNDALTVLADVERAGEKNDARGAKLRMASIRYTTGQKKEAHAIIDALIAERPRYAEARTAKARMLLSDGGHASEAVTHARHAVKSDEYLVAAHYTLGLALLAERKPAEAEQAFEAAARLSPRAAAPHLQLAKIRLARGDTGAAVAAAEAAARETTDAAATVVLAQTLRARGHVDRAARELTKRLTNSPEPGPLHLELGWLSLHRQDVVAARASFQEALRRMPGSLEARHGLIAADVAERKIDAARTRIADWRKASPNDAHLGVLAARVEIAAGDLAAAEGLLKVVITSDPAQLDAYDVLGRVYAGQGKVAEAVRQYQELADRSPEAATGARTMMGMLYEATNDRAAARSAYERVLADDPRAGVAANNLAWMLAQDAKLDDALRLASIARDSLRRRPEPEDTLGWVLLQKGQASEAIASFERARQRAPLNPVYHYHLGLAYVKNGEKARAHAAFSQALELKSDFAGAEDARTQVAALAEATVAAREEF
jgi:tetratricopeptide (TPR) repeat protein